MPLLGTRQRGYDLDVSTGELVNLLFLAFVSAGLGVTFRKRLSEIRDELKGDIATLRDELKRELTTLRDELKRDLTTGRSESRGDLAEVRREMAIMRSDLTQIALAVGATPRAAND